MTLAVPASRLLRLLLVAVAILHVLSFTATFIYHGLGVQGPYELGWVVRFFYMDKEKNLPTWFASGVLLLTTYVLWETGTAAKAFGTGYVRHWRILAFVFAFLSLDEIAQIHEVGSRAKIIGAEGTSYLSWIAIAAPLVIVFTVSYLRFLARLPAKVRWLIVAGGCVFVGGSVGMEIIGAFTSKELVGVQTGLASMKYIVAASIEELLEMLGNITFLYAIALYLQQYLRPKDTIAHTPAHRTPKPLLTSSSRVGAGGSSRSSADMAR